jgi:hypothetical protein
MKAVICTLFEDHYHHGLAALTNSLFCNGFKGPIFAGYRGSLPDWAKGAEENPNLSWKGARTLHVDSGLELHFLPVATEHHFTNFKPEFMLRLWEGPAIDAEAITYFDPDITIKCKWEFFENWMAHGVALVHEITANDMPPSHPIRKEWEKVICKCNKKPFRNLNSYINAGFCGISKKNQEFLITWKEIIDAGKQHFKLDAGQLIHQRDRTYLFYAPDQDSLNITAMCSEAPISELGPEGMDFIYGGWTMSHAVGLPKPWNKNFFLSLLKGRSPSLADKAYWRNATGPLNSIGPIRVKFKRAIILATSFLGRFYSVH